MAKQNPAAGGERSKVRVLWFEGDLGPGEIQALATAFAANRSNTLPGRTPPKQISAPATQNGTAEAEQEVDLETVEEADVLEDNGSNGTPRAASTPRKARPTPKPIDINSDGDGVSFEEFVKPLTAEQLVGPQTKFLVAAAWLHEHGEPKLNAVAVGHVVACYLHAEWTWDAPSNDPTDPFRKLRKEGFGHPAKGKDGTFEINSIGLKRVAKMLGAAPSGESA